jgi:peroxiredoxin
MSTTSLLEQTEKTRDAFLADLPDNERAAVAGAFERLSTSAVAALALKVGDPAADFELPNVRGGTLSLHAALESGPAVLSFYRGSWCPFCNLELNALQRRLPEIRAAGARLIAVSPQKPDASLDHAEKLDLQFDVLSDTGNRIAKRYGLIMTIDQSLRPLYLRWGIDVPAANGDDSYELPVPATYVIDTSGKIRAAFVDKDYTKRMEPQDILAALSQL